MTTEEQNALKRFNKILRHISHVQQTCLMLAERLMEADVKNESFARQLVARSMLHDNSKFFGIEWLHLHEDVKQKEPNLFQAALIQHQMTNPHHPEHWGGIDQMPKVYVAEMVCDWKARSDEFGTDLRSWVKDVAIKKLGITVQSSMYKEIKKYLDLLLDPKFV